MYNIFFSDLSNLLYAATRDVQLNSDVIMEKFSFKVPPKDAVAPKGKFGGYTFVGAQAFTVYCCTIKSS